MTPYLCCFKHFIYMRILYAIYDGNVCYGCNMPGQNFLHEGKSIDSEWLTVFTL